MRSRNGDFICVTCNVQDEAKGNFYNFFFLISSKFFICFLILAQSKSEDISKEGFNYLNKIQSEDKTPELLFVEYNKVLQKQIYSVFEDLKTKDAFEVANIMLNEMKVKQIKLDLNIYKKCLLSWRQYFEELLAIFEEALRTRKYELAKKAILDLHLARNLFNDLNCLIS